MEYKIKFEADINDILNELGTLPKEMETTGKKGSESLAKGIKDGSKGINAQAKQIGDNLENALNQKAAQSALKQGFDSVTQSVKSFGDRFKQAAANAKQDTKNLIDGFGNLKNSIVNVVTGTGSLSDGLQGVKKGFIDAGAASLKFIATPIGAIVAIGAGIAVATKEVLKYNESILDSAKLTENITKLTGKQADQARVTSGVLAETFGRSQQDILEAARNQVTSFGVSYSDALNGIKDDLISGAAVNEEYFSSLREYPKLFANAGFSFQEFRNIVQAGYDLGIYSDKLPDAIKEFGLSINEQTEGVKDALIGAFGQEFTGQLFKGINDGSITVKEALANISEEAKTASLTTAQNARLTADLLRGAGEDAGGFETVVNAVNVALSNERKELTALGELTAQIVQKNIDLAEAKDRALKSNAIIAFKQEFVNAWTEIQTGFFNAIAGIREFGLRVDVLRAANNATFAAIPKAASFAFSQILSGLKVIGSAFSGVGEIAKNAFSLRFEATKKSYNDFTSTIKNGGQIIGAGFSVAKDDIKQARNEAVQGAIEIQKATEKALLFQSQAKGVSQEIDTPTGASGGTSTAPKTTENNESKKTNIVEVNTLRRLELLGDEGALRLQELRYQAESEYELAEKNGEDLYLLTQLQKKKELDLIAEYAQKKADAEQEAQDKEFQTSLANLNAYFDEYKVKSEAQVEYLKVLYEDYGKVLEEVNKTTDGKNTERTDAAVAATAGIAANYGQALGELYANLDQNYENYLAKVEKGDAEFITKQEFTQREFLKASGILALQELQNYLRLQYVKIVAKQVAELGPAGFATGAASIVAIEGLLGVAKGQIQSFYGGTENLKGQSYDSMNGTLVMAHGGERIVPTHINRQMQMIPNNELPKAVNMYMNSKSDNSDVVSAIERNSMLKEMRLLRKEIKQGKAKINPRNGFYS